jgi:hypothetical protein
VNEQNALRESLWGKKRTTNIVSESPIKRSRSGRQAIIEPIKENEKPAKDFSQAYEMFILGFDAKKQKNL